MSTSRPVETVITPAGGPAVAARVRPVVGRVWTVLAGVLLLVVLVAPSRPSHVTPLALLRIPVEGLLFLALLLAVRGRVRTVTTALIAVALGLWAVVRVLDIGFYTFLARPFDPVHDWSFLGVGAEVVGRSHGRAGEIGAMVGAALGAAVLIGLVTLSTLRLTRVAARHRARSARAVAVLGVAWVVLAATGAHLVADSPVAARDYFDRLAQVRAGLRDLATFRTQLAEDAYRDTPGDQLLTALRGKDVMLVLIESYGRVALSHPSIAPDVTQVLADGERRLDSAGFDARSAFLTSPTVGGGSWLAHATLLSGAWVNNQERYTDLAASDRLTLTGAFQRAGWRTVGIMPGVTQGWPEGRFYAFDNIATFNDLEYAGPVYSFDTMPDQYVLSYFERVERAPAARDPVMAVIPLISSHAPWTPVPKLLDWGGIGDGSRYEPPLEPLQPAESVLRRDPARVRADYATAIGYSLESLLSYVEEYGDDDLVLIFLGDHQPVPVVTGDSANRDAPVSIVTRDRAVLDRIAGWGWQDGLRPDAAAPVWRMDAFRDQFLRAFR